ncbi:MAG TPA: hypothetical protein DCE41_05425 [Cytophagales bacterium]|nr:hypothetical protein [Cytophagales bacterium]HAA24395.1 hypothetical protein [Cytophagales bacterium]HAP62173.1 hypothetical protein [Cytophagales bacterium]
MEYTPETVQEGYQLLETHLQRAGLTPNPLEQVTWEDLKAWLESGVRYLLDENMEALLQLCYRVDLPESRVTEILSVSAPDAVAGDLAALILEREMQKVYYRAKYRNR